MSVRVTRDPLTAACYSGLLTENQVSDVID